MTNLDSLFEHLRAAPAPDELAAIDVRVFEGLALQREKTVSQKGLVLACTISMVVGLAASGLPASEARAGPIFGIPAIAPSHLLAR